MTNLSEKNIEERIKAIEAYLFNKGMSDANPTPNQFEYPDKLKSDVDDSGNVLGGDAAGVASNSAVHPGAQASVERSVAHGKDAQATGETSTAIGNNAQATDDRTTALGLSAKAWNVHATAVGYQSEASGYYSLALGRRPDADGRNGIAIGPFANSGYGDNAIAIGSDTVVTAADSIAAGMNAEASASEGIAIGTDAAATGQWATALGYQALAPGKGSISLGVSSEARDSSGVSIGHGSRAFGDRSISIGFNADVSYATNAVAIGWGVQTVTDDVSRIGGDQLVHGGSAGTVADADLNNGEITVEADEANNQMVIRYKTSGGTVREGLLDWEPLTTE